MKKSLLALILALAMMVMLFAGCGNAATSAAEAVASAAEGAAEEAAEAAGEAAEAVEGAVEEAVAPAEAEASAAEEPAETEAVEPAFEIEYPLVDEPTTLTYWQAWPPFLNEISEPKDAAMFAKLEEITGIHLDITAVSTAELTASDAAASAAEPAVLPQPANPMTIMTAASRIASKLFFTKIPPLHFVCLMPL